MIRPYGKSQILNYFAGGSSSIADTIILGVGGGLDGENMGYEVIRVPVNLIGLDTANSQIIFKARTPLEYSGVITEVGLYQGDTQMLEEDRNINVFPGGTAAGEWSILNTSVGTYIKEDSLRVQSETFIDTLMLDLTDFNDEDFLKLLVTTTSSATLTVKIGSDSSNYYQYTFTLANGKNVVKKAIGDCTTTGTVDRSDLKYIAVSSSVSVVLEGVRFENKAVNNPLYGMVAYQTVASIDKPVGTEKEIEYAMTITVGA